MKERLTGAIILVVLIVLLVPELLSGPKGPAVAPPVTGAASPSSEEPPLQSYTINLGDEHPQSQTANGSAPDSSGPPRPSVQAQAATVPDTDPNEASTTWDTTGADPQPNATIPSAVKPLSPSAAVPKPTPSAPPLNRAETSKAARTAVAEKPPVKAHVAAAQKAAPSAESAGWGVQIGVFGSKVNAERLVAQARGKGFKASVSPVASGKNKMYRVRVGPAADKPAAQDLQTKLKAAGIAHPDSKVVPYS